MDIRQEIIVNRPAAEVWEVLGNQFSDAYKWARGLDHSKGHGTPSFDDAPCGNRTCQVPGFGQIEEVIRKFESENHVLSYEVTKGFPGFISSAVNTWTLVPQGLSTKVMMHMQMQTTGIKGALMGPMMKMNLNKLITGVVKDFKTYVETGKPSAQKAKEIAKALKKAA
ncbi:MAG: SRPBCC family protein [Cyclobacteriaceae bacterium]